MTTQLLGMFGLPGGLEWGVILVVGLLLFGRRLPDIARSMGKSIVEFKKGLKDVRSEIESESDKTPRISPHEDPAKIVKE